MEVKIKAINFAMHRSSGKYRDEKKPFFKLTAETGLRIICEFCLPTLSQSQIKGVTDKSSGLTKFTRTPRQGA